MAAEEEEEETEAAHSLHNIFWSKQYILALSSTTSGLI